MSWQRDLIEDGRGSLPIYEKTAGDPVTKTPEPGSNFLVKLDPELGTGRPPENRPRDLFLLLDPKERKTYPIATGCLDYFPAALAAVAHVSKVGNDQHNPGQPLHWDRSKSTDEADALIRHFLERGTLDSDGLRHSAKVAWRALALLQKELEGEG